MLHKTWQTMLPELTMSYLNQGNDILKLGIYYIACFLSKSLKMFILDLLYEPHLLRLFKICFILPESY